MTDNPNKVTEDEQIKKDDVRFKELNTKKDTDRTTEENTELGDLKTKYAGRAEKRIGQLSGEKKAAVAAKEEAEDRALKAEQELKEFKDKPADTPIVGNKSETTEIGGKKYFTDTALKAQIDANEITEAAAVDYQTKRNEEKIVVRVTGEFEKKQEIAATQKAQQDDAQAVLKAHPEFNTKHANHNPNDPTYVEWKELVANGYGLSTGGLMKALKKAKKNLGIKDTPIDRSSDFEVEDTAAPRDKGGTKTQKEITLDANEEEAAVQMYTLGDVPNPKTGRPYTREEAISKAKVAKQRRR